MVRNRRGLSLKRRSVVQLVRIPACHAGGREFESRPDRKKFRAQCLIFRFVGQRLTAAWMIVSCLLVLARATAFVSYVPKLDVMKHLMALVALLVSTAAVAQIPTLP